jgi:GR25 family glycosyltransferase involved in LPS biosynthesis
MENLIRDFLENPNEKNGYKLLIFLRCLNMHNLNIMIGKFILSLYPHSIDIRSEIACSAFYSGQYKLSYDLYKNNLKYSNLNEKESFNIIFNQHFSIPHISDRYIYYNKELVEKIISRKKRPIPIITFTITSCKRFDLFEKTMNSFLNCCKDINMIDEWFCVDDNSSEEDRRKMQSKYPFFTFYWKTIEEKGHPQSMNIIKNNVKTEYIFHMEDDWKYFTKKKYISECLEILESNNQIGQCLINKNYAEIPSDIDIVGGIFSKTKSGLRYFIHEYNPDDKSKEQFNKKYGIGKNCAYWPHFSFRPSLLKRKVLDSIGDYNETISHFEMDYSYRYVNKGFLSAFLEGISCIHIGRLTSQRNNKSIPNAYELNGEAQFSGKEELYNSKFTLAKNIRTLVINLDRRQDRLEKFNKIAPINYEKFSAIDGSKLSPTIQLQQIFEGNDYNMRSGIVGCAMTHIKLYIELLQSSTHDIYCIFEDDVTFTPNFKQKINHVMKELQELNWDLVYLGHSLYQHHKQDHYYDKHKIPVLEKWDSNKSLKLSMGGAFAYLITKKGADKLLNFINHTGMTNAIDTMQQKYADTLNVFYCNPHLVYSECCLPNNLIDTDIQLNFSSLTIPYENRIKIEKDFYGDFTEIDSFQNLLLFYNNSDNFEKVVFYTPKNNIYFSEDDSSVFSFFPMYFVGKTVVIVPKPTEEVKNNRYFDRLQKNKKYNINDAIKYK